MDAAYKALLEVLFISEIEYLKFLNCVNYINYFINCITLSIINGIIFVL